MTVPQLYVACVAAFVGAVVCAWQVRRALREPSERDRIVREARARTGLADSTPGIDTALQDACELIWDLDAYDPAAAIDEGLTRLFEQLGPPPADDPELEAGCGRLWDAIAEHRKEEK